MNAGNASAPGAMQALGDALSRGDWARAEPLAREVLRSNPDVAMAWAAIAESLALREPVPEEALHAYRKALDLKPGWTPMRYNFANALRRLGRWSESEAVYGEVLQARPDHEGAALNRAVSLHQLGRTAQAMNLLEELIARAPGNARAWVNLAGMLMGLRRMDEAENAARQAVALAPDGVESRYQLGQLLFEQGQAAEAISHLDTVVAAAPGNRQARSARLFMLCHDAALPPAALIEAHRSEGRRLVEEAGAWRVPMVPRGGAGGRIRVGLVSPDLRGHAVSCFLEPALRARDRAGVELFAYYVHPTAAPGKSVLGPLFDHWRDCGGLADEALAAMVVRDRIDVLIDLAGHTAHNRLGLFAARLAPVQWQWFGYPLFNGLDEFDARLTDAFFDPPGANLAQERLLYLPARMVWRGGGPVAAEVGCERTGGGPFTFGSFNSLAKLSPAVLDCWVQVLRAVPGSRLVLGHADSAGFKRRLAQRLAEGGVDPARFEMLAKLPMKDYLEAHRRIDVLLDAFPYNGGTTTCHALWQGVPVVTLAGAYGPARLSASILGHLGLHELVHDNVAGYIQCCHRLSQEPALLAGWRKDLRARFEASAMGQPPRMMAALEQAMRQSLPGAT